MTFQKPLAVAVTAALLSFTALSSSMANEATVGTPPAITENDLKQMKTEAEANPNNLDLYFNYAKAATVLGKADEAEFAYKHMLEINPNLPRVKLDLGLLYGKTGRFKEAKALLEEVLQTNPPEAVKNNINNLLADINKAMKKDKLLIAVSFGINNDSNANSAASTGETTFNEISIPLSANSKRQTDTQEFGLLSLTHLHKFEVPNNNFDLALNSNTTFYRTNQTSEHNLDLSMVSVKTGPMLTYKPWKAQMGFNLGVSQIVLNSTKYLKTRSGDLVFKYAPRDDLIFDSTTTYEYRKFANSPSVRTNTSRTGNAYQEKLGATYALTPKDIFSANVTWRVEDAPRADYYGMHQTGYTGSYTRILPYDISLNLSGTFKESFYNAPDPTINDSVMRHDRERSFGLTFSKKFPKNITFTTGYQYKNSTSNIQNYDYVNHRISAAISWAFSP